MISLGLNRLIARQGRAGMKKLTRNIRILFGLIALSVGWMVYQIYSPAALQPIRLPGEQRFQRHYTPQRVDRFWMRAQQEVYKSQGELLAQNEREMRKGMNYRKLIRGNPNDQAIALTFDDGPHPQYSYQLLAILQRYRVKATFFVVGKMAEQYPEIIRAEQASGHLIGNHTYHHVDLTKIPVDEVETEWLACNDVVQAITGNRIHFCRPPGGDYDTQVITAAMRSGLTTVLWTDDPGDYASPGEVTIEQRALRRIGNGGIVLLHDGNPQTIDVLPQIIERFQRDGFHFLTVDAMARSVEKMRK